MDKKGEREGISRLSFKKLLSHSDGKFRKETLHCVTNLGYQNILGVRKGGGVVFTICRRKSFLLLYRNIA